jgi:hypothetical protein
VVYGSKIPTTLPIDEVGKKHYYSDEKSINDIQGGLAKIQFVKVM